MTINATAVWEVRPTNGDNTFGGGFDSAIAGAGTDYTQQNTAQLSLSDIAHTGGATTISSASGGFVSALIGNALRMNAGTNVTVGWYFIVSVVDTNTAVLDRSINAGTTTNGAGKVGGATKSLSGQTTTPLLGNLNGVQAGNTIYIKNEAWNEAVTTATGNPGTAALPVVIEGYNTTRGDRPTGSSRPHNNRAAASGTAWLQQLSHYHLRYLWISHAGTIGIQDTAGANTYVGVRSSNHTQTGWTITGASVALVICEADTNTTNGITATSGSLVIYGSYIHGNTLIGLSTAAGPVVVSNCIIAANGSHGWAVITGNQQVVLLGTTIDGQTGTSDGLNVATGKVLTAGSVLMNNIFSNNGRDGIRVTDASSDLDVWSDYNNFHSNVGTAQTNFLTGSNDTALDPQYTNRAGGDYSIANASLTGFPGTYPGSATLGAQSMGGGKNTALTTASRSIIPWYP